MANMYTAEIVASKLENLEKASQLVADALNEGTPEKDMKPLKDAVREAATDYNTTNERYYYHLLVDTFGQDALMEGVKAFYLPGAKKASQRKDKRGHYLSKVADDKDAKIDLLEFMDTCGIEKFAHEDWYTRVQKFAYIVANAINKELGNDPAFTYMVDDAAKKFEFAPDADPASANSGRKALQTCVDGILFLPSEKDADKNALCVGKKHWRFVREVMTRKGRGKGQVIVAGTADIAGMVAEVTSILLDPDKGDVRLTTEES